MLEIADVLEESARFDAFVVAEIRSTKRQMLDDPAAVTTGRLSVPQLVESLDVKEAERFEAMEEKTECAATLRKIVERDWTVH